MRAFFQLAGLAAVALATCAAACATGSSTMDGEIPQGGKGGAGKGGGGAAGADGGAAKGGSPADGAAATAGTGGAPADASPWGEASDACVPAGPEQCNGKDDDCNGQVDDGDPGGGAPCATGMPGACADGTNHCVAGKVTCVPAKKPGADPETCNGKDDDCNGQVDDGDPGGGAACQTGLPGACAAGVQHCTGGIVKCAPTVQPGTLPETCNAQDDDCDGQTDEGNPGGGQPCSTGLPGVCAPGTSACQAGTVKCVPSTLPGALAETCNGLDDDCNGQTDDKLGGQPCTTGLLGACAAGTTQCVGGGTKCQQNKLPAPETCNGQDDNCDGQTDEGNPGGGAYCSTGLQGICAAGVMTCQGGQLGCKQSQMPQPEICGNGVDENCDGTPDDGCGGTCHDKCVQGDKMKASCGSCEASICAADSFCCSSSWDAVCVSEVRTVCGSLVCPEAQGSCAHSLCKTGTALSSFCDASKAGCVSKICAADSWCCSVDWDSLCVGEVASVCGKSCN